MPEATAEMATARIEPAVSFGSSQRSWVSQLISYVSDHGGVRVVGTVLTHDDALAMEFDVLVIDDVSSVLSPRLVDRLQTSGRLVIGVFDAERGTAAKDRLLAAGVDGAVASDATASEIVRAVVDTVRQRGVDEDFASLVEDLDAPVDFHPADHAPVPATTHPGAGYGEIIVVAGSDGVTEVAIGIAQATSGRGASTAIVDMDTLEPSIAQRLGMPLTPNIFTATEDLRLRSSLQDSFAVHPVGVALVAGIPNPREWENLSESEAADLVGELATGFSIVIVKVNRHLEDLSSFAGSAGRFDIGRRLVAMANHLVAVTSASPLGTTRLLAMTSDARNLTAAPLHVVINQAPSSQFVQGEIAEELGRTLSFTSLTFLPSDSRVQKAAWQGEFVRVGSFTKRIGSLADWFVDRKPRRMWRQKPAGPSGAEQTP
jgi:hypothetical protein